MTSSVPLTSVKPLNRILPFTFELKQNYPNPFNPSTTIIFGIPARSQVTLIIYNLLGKEVAALVRNETMSAGSYMKQWNAENMPSGIYFYRLSAVPSTRRDLVPSVTWDGQAGTCTETKKLILLR